MLLFQDDIVKLDQTAENLQKSNIILQEFQNLNRMMFHETKTIVMTNRKEQTNIKLNDRIVPETEEYKYLGDLMRLDDSYSELIKERKYSIAGTVAEIVNIENEIKQHSIMAAVQYLNGIIIPKLLLNSEAWNNLTIIDYQQLEQSQSQSIKRLLHLPYTTPTRAIYNEMGLMTIKNRIAMRKMMYLHKLLNKDQNNLARQILIEQPQLPGPTWISKVRLLIEELEIGSSLEEIEEFSKDKWKSIVTKSVWLKEQKEFAEWCENSSKCNNMQLDKIELKRYLKETDYETAKVILEMRTGMIDVKTNYKNKYNDTICRNCEKEEETTEHYINCCTEQEDKQIMQHYHEIWTMSDTKIVERVARHVLKVLKTSLHINYM